MNVLKTTEFFTLKWWVLWFVISGITLWLKLYIFTRQQLVIVILYSRKERASPNPWKIAWDRSNKLVFVTIFSLIFQKLVEREPSLKNKKKKQKKKTTTLYFWSFVSKGILMNVQWVSISLRFSLGSRKEKIIFRVLSKSFRTDCWRLQWSQRDWRRG